MDEEFEFQHNSLKKKRKSRIELEKSKDRKFLGNNRSEQFAHPSEKRKKTRAAQRRFFLGE